MPNIETITSDLAQFNITNVSSLNDSYIENHICSCHTTSSYSYKYGFFTCLLIIFIMLGILLFYKNRYKSFKKLYDFEKESLYELKKYDGVCQDETDVILSFPKDSSDLKYFVTEYHKIIL